jgi:hypothetical protein
VGTGHRARTWNYTLNITSADPPIGSSLTACDLASHDDSQERTWRLEVLVPEHPSHQGLPPSARYSRRSDISNRASSGQVPASLTTTTTSSGSRRRRSPCPLPGRTRARARPLGPRPEDRALSATVPPVPIVFAAGVVRRVGRVDRTNSVLETAFSDRRGRRQPARRSSSQSNMRWSSRLRAIGSQCQFAPSAALNLTIVLSGPGSAS